MCACVRARVRACVRACVRVCVCVLDFRHGAMKYRNPKVPGVTVKGSDALFTDTQYQYYLFVLFLQQPLNTIGKSLRDWMIVVSWKQKR